MADEYSKMRWRSASMPGRRSTLSLSFSVCCLLLYYYCKLLLVVLFIVVVVFGGGGDIHSSSSRRYNKKMNESSIVSPFNFTLFISQWRENERYRYHVHSTIPRSLHEVR